jgi:hypothetical protein
VMRKEQRNSKSLVVPFVQIKNVFRFAGFSAVVSPLITPSLNVQSSGFPVQPVRSLPLHNPLKSFSTRSSIKSFVVSVFLFCAAQPLMQAHDNRIAESRFKFIKSKLITRKLSANKLSVSNLDRAMAPKSFPESASLSRRFHCVLAPCDARSQRLWR